MKIEELNRRNLEVELAKQGLKLVWFPEQHRLKENDLVVFGAEQYSNEDEPLIAGFRSGNSPQKLVDKYHEHFLKALEAIGIPRESLHSNFIRVCRGKIWPTFVARLEQKAYEEISAIRRNEI